MSRSPDWRWLSLVLLFGGLSLPRDASGAEDGWLTDTAREIRFVTVDIFVDSGEEPLAAYQVVFSAGNGAQIVGIEGGEPEAFREPPHYDPKAIRGNRVILAAFSIAPAGQLPKGKVRVATIHLQVQPGKKPNHQIKLQTAGSPEGKPMAAQGSVMERNQR